MSRLGKLLADDEKERSAVRLAAAIADIERVAREWPDGIHTCAELQQLEPGRRPCTCGTCPTRKESDAR